MAKSFKVAIVHDWLYGGGAEKVVAELHKIFPDAPIYTSYCTDEWRQKLDDKVVTGYLQRWPFSKIRRFLPLLRQWWFARLDLKDFDVIISSSGNGEAKFVRKNRPGQVHICYCHTPTHFYWRHYQSYVENPSFRPYWLARLGLRLLVKPLRKRDWRAAQNVDFFIANSTTIQADIKKFYNRDSQTIFPPVNIERFSNLAKNRNKKEIPAKPRCIIWGRIVPQKRLDIAIESCQKLGWQLYIIGDGPDIDRLKKMTDRRTNFLGFVSDDDLENYISQADLFLFCSHEDFGVAPVEALATGLPVVAYGAGGALDYISQINGWLFDEQTSDSLTKILKGLPKKTIEPRKISESVRQFSAEKFCRKITNLIELVEKDKL